MGARVPRMTPLRLLTVTWVILWMTSVPFFHTHLPDFNGPTALQGGLAHTVFSPDLPGEFSRFVPVSQRNHLAHLSNRVSNSPELAFVLSSEDSKKQMGERSTPVVLCCLPAKPSLSVRILESRASPRTSVRCAAPGTPRAPPSVVSS